MKQPIRTDGPKGSPTVDSYCVPVLSFQSTPLHPLQPKAISLKGNRGPPRNNAQCKLLTKHHNDFKPLPEHILGGQVVQWTITIDLVHHDCRPDEHEPIVATITADFHVLLIEWQYLSLFGDLESDGMEPD